MRHLLADQPMSGLSATGCLCRLFLTSVKTSAHRCLSDAAAAPDYTRHPRSSVLYLLHQGQRINKRLPVAASPFPPTPPHTTPIPLHAAKTPNTAETVEGTAMSKWRCGG